MKQVPHLAIRLVIAGLALFGLVGVAPVSWLEFLHGDACPHLGPVPVCYIVMAGYGILVACAFRPLWSAALFIVGFVPVFAFAAAGSGAELFGFEVCPRTEASIPKCFFSLALALAILAPFLFHHLKSRSAQP